MIRPDGSVGDAGAPHCLFRYEAVATVPKYQQILGANIRVARKCAELSQEKLAEKADLHPTYISEVERGKENISIGALVRIAKPLGVSVHDLTTGL